MTKVLIRSWQYRLTCISIFAIVVFMLEMAYVTWTTAAANAVATLPPVEQTYHVYKPWGRATNNFIEEAALMRMENPIVQNASIYAMVVRDTLPINGTVNTLDGQHLFYQSIQMEGTRSIWKRPIYSLDNARAAAWPNFSTTVYQEADLLWSKLIVNSTAIVLGLHARIGDYDSATQENDFLDAVKAQTFDLILVCSDTPTSPKIQRIQEAFPKTILCPSSQTDLFTTAVLQTLLTKTKCFIGLDISTFTWRIWARRALEGNIMCDSLVFAR